MSSGTRERLNKRKILLAAIYAWGIPLIITIAVKLLSYIDISKLPLDFVPPNPGNGLFTGKF